MKSMIKDLVKEEYSSLRLRERQFKKNM